MSIEYDAYLHEHIENVGTGLRWMDENLTLTPSEKFAIGVALRDSLDHDATKYGSEEYDAYDAYFYGGNRSSKVVNDFNIAWLHHIHNNPHHWQHWILVNDDAKEGTVALEMPTNYIFEMIADWWTFSWRTGNLKEIFKWYADHKERIIFHKKTLREVERILKMIEDKLEELDNEQK